jgi:hypothetical protein
MAAGPAGPSCWKIFCHACLLLPNDQARRPRPTWRRLPPPVLSAS